MGDSLNKCLGEVMCSCYGFQWSEVFSGCVVLGGSIFHLRGKEVMSREYKEVVSNHQQGIAELDNMSDNYTESTHINANT